MNLSKLNVFSKNIFLEECKTFFSATLIAFLIFGGTYAYDAYAQQTQTNTLTVTVAAATTFTVSTNSFGTLTPGTPLFATSTIAVITNSTLGWNITMYGNNQGSGAASTTLYLSPTTYTTNIADGTEWNATSTATTSSALLTSATITSGVDFLYFRVMTASGTAAFRSTTWWGADDTPFTNAKWAGVASSTVSGGTTGPKIGRISVNDQMASSTLNTVQYYLDVPANQPQGAYTGDLTFTWTTGT